jgi:signal transduction histidine kinase
MMHSFLNNNREELIRRCRNKVAQRSDRAATKKQLENGVPRFLDQLIRTLRSEQSGATLEGLAISGPANGTAALSEVGETAAQHGKSLLSLGFTIDQVVHDYGDLCQSITDLAFERDAPFAIAEFRTLNRCLDNAMADAVTEFSYQRDSIVAAKFDGERNEAFGVFAHELRNYLGTAVLAFTAVKAGNLTLSGATGMVLERSHTGMGALIDKALAEVRTNDNLAHSETIFSLADFISEASDASALSAETHGCTFTASDVAAEIFCIGNRVLLQSALANLLQNAFKFTHAHTKVTLHAYTVADRVLIDVKDHCGGLPIGLQERMFEPFAQGSGDKSGLGLGLSIARRDVEASGGTLKVRNVPGVGCVFTINLSRHRTPSAKPPPS